MFKRVMKNRKGSETIEQLIVIAIMGGLAITAITSIATSIKGQDSSVVNSLSNNLSAAQNAVA